jgi:hypothetical protein
MAGRKRTKPLPEVPIPKKIRTTTPIYVTPKERADMISRELWASIIACCDLAGRSPSEVFHTEETMPAWSLVLQGKMDSITVAQIAAMELVLGKEIIHVREIRTLCVPAPVGTDRGVDPIDEDGSV